MVNESEEQPPAGAAPSEVPSTTVPMTTPDHGADDDPPTFTGKQVSYLLNNMGRISDVQSAEQQSATQSEVLRAGGVYDSDFGWMHLLGKTYLVKLLIAVALIALGIRYALPNSSPARGGIPTLDFLLQYQHVIMIVMGTLLLAHLIVRWRMSHLYTTETKVMYAVRSFWPLLVLPSQQEAKLTKIDAKVYSQNLIERIFRMNSGTLTLDTAAQKDTGLEKMKGVKNIQLLREDVG